MTGKVYCSFCGKRDDEVLCLIAGPTVFICNECVELCNDIVFEHRVVRAVKRLMPECDIKAPSMKPRPLSEFVAAVRAEIAASGMEAATAGETPKSDSTEGDSPTAESGDAQ